MMIVAEGSMALVPTINRRSFGWKYQYPLEYFYNTYPNLPQAILAPRFMTQLATHRPCTQNQSCVSWFEVGSLDCVPRYAQRLKHCANIDFKRNISNILVPTIIHTLTGNSIWQYVNLLLTSSNVLGEATPSSSNTLDRHLSLNRVVQFAKSSVRTIKFE